jgi:hypothetical protein
MGLPEPPARGAAALAPGQRRARLQREFIPIREQLGKGLFEL